MTDTKQKPDGWTSTSDELPKMHERVLVSDDGFVTIQYIDTPMLSQGKPRWCSHHRDLSGDEIEDTWWKPLPKAAPANSLFLDEGASDD